MCGKVTKFVGLGRSSLFRLHVNDSCVVRVPSKGMGGGGGGCMRYGMDPRATIHNDCYALISMCLCFALCRKYTRNRAHDGIATCVVNAIIDRLHVLHGRNVSLRVQWADENQRSTRAKWSTAVSAYLHGYEDALPLYCREDDMVRSLIDIMGSVGFVTVILDERSAFSSEFSR